MSAEDIQTIRDPASDESAIASLPTKIKNYENTCSYRVCKESRGHRKLRELRHHQTLTTLLLDTYLARVENLKQYIRLNGIPETYKSIETYQEALKAKVLPYNMIFAPGLDKITSSQKTCAMLPKAQFAAQLRQEIQIIDRDRGKLADLLARFDQR